MPRPTKPRRIGYVPKNTVFNPQIQQNESDIIMISYEEVEALRLADFEGLDQVECAEFMRVSRGTFQRIIKEARHKVSESIVYGIPLVIKGGNYSHEPQEVTCKRCHDDWHSTYNKNCPNCGSDEIVDNLSKQRRRQNRYRNRNRH